MLVLIQVKIFLTFNQEQELERSINDWLTDHPDVIVRDIKFSTSQATTTAYDNGDTQLAALVIYSPSKLPVSRAAETLIKIKTIEGDSNVK